MPYACCVPGCCGNYLSGSKVSIFGFPKCDNLKRKWINSIPREDFVPTDTIKIMDVSFLLFVKYIMLLSGTLPSGMVTYNRSIYKIYGHIIQISHIILISLFYIEIPSIWEDKEKVVESINLITTYTLVAFKVLLCRSKAFGNFVNQMMLFEQKIKVSGNKDILRVYRLFATRSKFIQLYYISIAVAGIVQLTVPYFVKYIILWDETNHDNTLERPLPFLMWFPFDKSDHYILGFFLCFYMTIVTTLYYICGQGLLIILPIYISFRLRLIGYLLKNIKDFTRKISRKNEDSDNDENVEVIIRFCIKQHLSIIRFTSALNNSIRYLMLLEFVVFSAQIASILFEIMTNESKDVKIFSSTHLVLMIVQLLTMYAHADEIKEESATIADALYDTEWYMFNKNAKNSIYVIMIRAQQPLALTVGPFGEMSLEVALNILKAAYTYVTFLQHTYKKT